MPIFEHDNIAQHFEISGDGPPLLMIAGMMSDSASWAPLIPLLEPHFTLIRPDNRSTGRTTPWDAPASVYLFAADCAALIRHLNLGPVHVLGHSLGGMIGWEFCRANPDLVQSLTLAASAPLRLARNVAVFKNMLAIRQSNAPPNLWLHTLFAWLFAPAVFETPTAIANAAAASLAYPHAQTADAMAHQITALDGYKPDTATPPSCPTLAILAQSDLIMPPELALPVLGTIPNRIVPGAGHSIHWDAPHAVVGHFLSFIEETST